MGNFRKVPQLGILGSGQLSRMLAQAALSLGFSPKILADAPDSPATQVCPDFSLGSIRDPKVLREFFSDLDLVIFENEFIPCDLIQGAAEHLSLKFCPTLEALHYLQDKLNQKTILKKLKIPHTPFMEAPFPLNEPERWLAEVRMKLGTSFVLKWAQLGYDGKGTFTQKPGTPDSQSVLFCNEATLKGVRIFAEQFVPFRRELAIVACHSIQGEFASYPPVISEQENHVCLWAKGPASIFSVRPALIRAAQKAAESLARAIPLHGTFAIEFFETPKGQLLVNEIAPRVHNTGHFTLDAADTSQFENHIRAVSGLPLGSTQTAPAFAMINLLGPPKFRKRIQAPLLPSLQNDIHLHWYGKREITPGRKMGHLNGKAASRARLKPLISNLEKCKNAWLDQIRRNS